MESNLNPTPDMIPAAAEPKPVKVEANPLLDTWLWQPNLIVFVSSACIMILELVAGRIIAPYVGVSLYTWTSIIGVVLAGISLGNYLGGQLADRWASLRFLGGVFLLGGLSSFGILAADRLGNLTPGAWPIVANILITTTILFFLPCLILGTVSPVVAKLAVRDLAKTGSTVGKIYAAGTVGSILGTFMTGFVLISWFGTFAIVWGVAALLLVLGLLFIVGHRWQVMLAAGLVIAAGSALAFNQGWLHGPCLRETNYFCIKIREEERDGETVRILILDRLVHSYTSLADPTKLVYGYEKVYAEITAYRARHDNQLRALFIGGGGYTFPRYMEAIYPNSDIDVIEIDPGVTQVAHDWLGLSPETRITTFNQDARLFLEQTPSNRYDLILGDAFNDFSVPYHLTTKEFNDRVEAWLVDDGLYLVNMIDGVRGDFLRAYVHTLRQNFRYVYLAPATASWRISPRTTFVLIGTNAPLELLEFTTIDAGDGEALLAGQVLSQAEVDDFLAEGQVVLLTDEYAPVDQMLAPVVRGEE
jgi:spermidine synthase